MVFVARLDHGAVLAHLHHRNLAVAGQFVDGLARFQLGEGLGLRLVGEDDIHVILHQIVEEGVVGFHHVIGCHVDGYDAARFLGEAHRPCDKLLVLNQISLDMEIVVALEEGRVKVVRAQLQGGAHIAGEGALRIGAGDEHHAAAAGLGAVEHVGMDAVLLHGALEEVPQVVVADLAQEAALHAEDGGAGDGIGGAAARHVLDAVFLQRVPDAVSRLHVYVLHAAQGQVVPSQEGVVRQDSQDVRQCVADAKDGFHIFRFNLQN